MQALGKKKYLVLLILISALCIVVGIIFYSRYINQSPVLVTSSSSNPQDWLTFTSTSNRFSIKYPPNFQTTDLPIPDAEAVVFSGTDPDLKSDLFNKILLSASFTPLKEASLEKLVEQRLGNIREQYRYLNKPLRQTQVLGHPAYEIVGVGGSYMQISTLFLVGGDVYEITAGRGNTNGEDVSLGYLTRLKTYHDQLLASFKLLN